MLLIPSLRLHPQDCAHMARATATTLHQSAADTSAAVDEFMATLEHPAKPAIEAMRRIILRADPRIAEGIKWKSPSFRTSEYFATVNLRAKTGVGVILHFGAKVRQLPADTAAIADPQHLLKWLAPDRAALEFVGLADLMAKESALTAIVRQWIAVA